MDDAQGALFGVAELAALPNAGRAEAGLAKALEDAHSARIIGPTDAGLVAAALIAARALDHAETIASAKDRAYAVTALLPPFQKALHGLRMPAEVTPANVPADPNPAGAAATSGDWLGDALGPR